MVDMGLITVGIVAILLLLLCSAFFSSTEIALFSLSMEWIDEQAATGDNNAVILQELRTDPHRALITVLVGNNIVNIAISSIIAVLVASFAPAGVAIIATTLVASLIILIVGEIIPKAFGLGNAQSWALRVAPTLNILEILLSPLTTVLETVTDRVNARLHADTEIEKPYLE